MKKDLRGKKILYLGARFFDYEIEIKTRLESMGAEVDFYNERPNDNFFTRVIIRLRLKALIYNKINKYYNQLLIVIKKEKYDYVLIISPETIPEKHLSALRDRHKEAKFILYMWDSFKNKNTGYDVTKYFDKIMTFDENDAKNNNRLIFLPLFYIPIYKSISQIKESYKYDYFLACTIHSDRYKVFLKLKSQAAKKGLSLYNFLYFHSKIIYWGRKFFDLNFLLAKKNEFSFTPISHAEIIDIISQSKIIVDIQHPNQSGLTNRTFEAIGSNKKLITTNQNIKNYDFYNPKNIFIIDRDNPILDEEFLNGDYQKPSERIYNKYSLTNWIKVIFDIEGFISEISTTKLGRDKKILITGITGFVGSNLVRNFGLSNNFTIYGLDIKNPEMKNVEKIFGWDELDKIPPVEAIIHLAGKAHNTSNTGEEQDYIDINYGLTKKIYDFYLLSQTQQFYLMSSIAAVTDQVDGVLFEESNPNPTTPYGRSKRMAENYLLANKPEGEKHIYIFRPCMIYGPQNKGNLNLLYNFVSKGVPWPLGSFNNIRSFLSVDNLSVVFNAFLDNNYATGIYQIADDEPISTNELVEIIASVTGKKIKILYLPKKFINVFARIGTVFNLPLTTERLAKLTANSVVSNEKVKTTINVLFPVKTVDGIRDTIETFGRK